MMYEDENRELPFKTAKKVFVYTSPRCEWKNEGRGVNVGVLVAGGCGSMEKKSRIQHK